MATTDFSTALPNLAIAKLGLGVVTSESQPNPIQIDEGTAGFIVVSGGPGGADTWQAAGAVVFPSITGDVTITSSGVSTITSGAVTNFKVAADAGIEYSKLDLTGSITNSDIASAAAIAYFKLNLSGSILNSDIATSAAIAYSKLNLTSSVVNADISPSAAIAYSKLNLALSITNADIANAAGIVYSKLSLTSSVVNADISPSAAIAYSKLNLSSSITNSDISASAAIAYSKLNLSSSITNADIATGAAIARSKVASGSASHVVINDGSGNLSSEAQLAGTRGGTGASNTGTLTWGSSTLAFTLTGATSLTLPTSGTLATNDLATSATNGLINYFKTTSVSANGSFTSGTVSIVRWGNIVTVYSSGLTHASANAVSSSSTLLPSWAIPPQNVSTTYNQSGTQSRNIEAQTGGILRATYFDWAGSGSARTDTGSFALTYAVV